MKNLNDSSTLRRILVLAFLVAVLTFALTVTAPVSNASPSNCTYYNNAAHSTVVGQFGKDCCNNNVAWGVKTQFSQCGGCFFCVPPPPR